MNSGHNFGPFGAPQYIQPPPIGSQHNQMQGRNFSNGLHPIGPPSSNSPSQAFNNFQPPSYLPAPVNNYDYPQQSFSASPFL